MIDLQKLINLGISNGLSDIEVYSQNNTRKTINVTDGELDNLKEDSITGYSVRGLYNGKMGSYTCENITEDDFIEIINHIKTNASLITSTEVEELYDGSGVYKDIPYVESDSNKFNNLEKINLLKELHKGLLEKDSRIVKVCHNQYVESSGITKIVNSKGLNLERKSSYQYAVVGALATDGKQNTNGYSQSLVKNFKEIDKEKLVKESTEFALNQLGAGKVKTGTYKAVFNRDVICQILSAFASNFSSEAALKKMTKLVGKEGTKLFGDNINIVDNPFDEVAAIQTSFDDEGVPTSVTKVVENGVFNTFLYNLKTARAFGKKSTGNGFKAGLAAPIGVDFTNLELLPGQASEEELIKECGEGIFINDVAGLHAGLDTISGDFNLQSSGRMIHDGKLGEAVTLFVISGNFFTMMNNISALGDNIEKNYLGVGAPSILLKELVISGE